MALNRRQLINRGAAGAGLVVAGNLTDLFKTVGAAGPDTPARVGVARGPGRYGALVPDADGILDLPEGFSYRVVTQTGDEMSDGAIVPDELDGMGLFTDERGRTFLVCNSEQEAIVGEDDGEAYELEFPTTAAAGYTYDPKSGGGTITVELDPDGNVVNRYVSLAGTANNCAGGVTPWGTWLTCEEDSSGADEWYDKDHGFVFEVDPFDQENNADPTPLTALGRFDHEAIAIDPRDGMVFLTEDADEPNGLLYRATPVNPLGGHGSLRDGAVLEALAATDDAGELVPDLSAYSEIGTTLSAGWVEIPDPLAAETSTREQLEEVTRSRKFEGIWWGNDSAYVVASYARADDGSVGEHDGQVWKLDPAAGTLELVAWFGVNAEPESDNFDSPDNVTVAPWGGLILCADGEGVQHLWTVAPDGSHHMFARNARDDNEFAGAVFSADGATLYVNIMSPGITMAITGPWEGEAAGSEMAPTSSAA